MSNFKGCVYESKTFLEYFSLKPSITCYVVKRLQYIIKWSDIYLILSMKEIINDILLDD